MTLRTRTMASADFRSIYTTKGEVVLMLAGVPILTWQCPEPDHREVEWCEQQALEALAFRVRELLREGP
jgi:hypothetical protein